MITINEMERRVSLKASIVQDLVDQYSIDKGVCVCKSVKDSYFDEFSKNVLYVLETGERLVGRYLDVVDDLVPGTHYRVRGKENNYGSNESYLVLPI